MFRQRILKPHVVILLLTLASFFSFVWRHRERYLRPYDYEYFGKLYSESQYVKGELSENGIGDDGLYAFAGYYYLTGGDISQVNFEHPPLGKYLIGVSALVFGNELVINIIYGLILIWVVYLLGYELTNSRTIAALTVLFVIIDPLVTNQLAISLLDLPMTVFFLIGIYFFIKGVKAKRDNKKFLLSVFFFSISFVIRFFPFLPIILLFLIAGLWKIGDKRWKLFGLYCGFLLPTIYLISHAAYFYYHPSLIEFLRYQKWIIAWRLNNPIKPGNIITTLLFGRYQRWWSAEADKWLISSDWTTFTSFIFITGLLGLWYWRKNFPHWLISLIVFIFLLYVATYTVGVAKFILPIYPILVLSSIQTLMRLVNPASRLPVRD